MTSKVERPDDWVLFLLFGDSNESPLFALQKNQKRGNATMDEREKYRLLRYQMSKENKVLDWSC